MKIYYFFSHDEQLVQRAKPPTPTKPDNINVPQLLATQQFGVSLQFIVDNNGGEVIPPIVRQCVEYLDNPDGKCFYIFVAYNTQKQIKIFCARRRV